MARLCRYVPRFVAHRRVNRTRDIGAPRLIRGPQPSAITVNAHRIQNAVIRRIINSHEAVRFGCAVEHRTRRRLCRDVDHGCVGRFGIDDDICNALCRGNAVLGGGHQQLDCAVIATCIGDLRQLCGPRTGDEVGDLNRRNRRAIATFTGKTIGQRKGATGLGQAE